jgi:Flp pilus assembly pilin Flp
MICISAVARNLQWKQRPRCSSLVKHADQLVSIVRGSTSHDEGETMSFLAYTKRWMADEKAAEVTELGIVLALIVALSILVIKSIGGKVLAAFTATDTALP